MGGHKWPLERRFWLYVEPEPNSGCWLWVGAMADGYGVIQRGGMQGKVLAHRYSYEMFREPIPMDFQIDHRCRMRSCVNPNHLEVVTARENFLRGIHRSAQIHRTGLCLRGHPLTEDNLHINTRGKRQCRTCWLANSKLSYERRKGGNDGSNDADQS